jgi:integrase
MTTFWQLFGRWRNAALSRPRPGSPNSSAPSLSLRTMSRWSTHAARTPQARGPPAGHASQEAPRQGDRLFHGHPRQGVVRCSGWATLLTILTAARTGEIIGARVEEFEDLKYAGRALWRVPESRMKAGREHLAPLSMQAVSVVKAAIEQAGRSAYSSPGADGRADHVGANTLLFDCYAIGFRNKTTMHGFPGAFSP